MARITVEDCLAHVDNRFDLVLKASKRARKLALSGVDPMLDWQNDKPTVMALREIAAGHKFTESDLNLNNRGYAAATSNEVDLATDAAATELRTNYGNNDGLGMAQSVRSVHTASLLDAGSPFNLSASNVNAGSASSADNTSSASVFSASGSYNADSTSNNLGNAGNASSAEMYGAVARGTAMARAIESSDLGDEEHDFDATHGSQKTESDDL